MYHQGVIDCYADTQAECNQGLLGDDLEGADAADGTWYAGSQVGCGGEERDRQDIHSERIEM